jgi:hypothetical protein
MTRMVPGANRQAERPGALGPASLPAAVDQPQPGISSGILSPASLDAVEGAAGCSCRTVVWNPECIKRRLKIRQPGLEDPDLL